MTARFITVFTIASKRHSATLMEIVGSSPPTPTAGKPPLVRGSQLLIQHTQRVSTTNNHFLSSNFQFP